MFNDTEYSLFPYSKDDSIYNRYADLHGPTTPLTFNQALKNQIEALDIMLENISQELTSDEVRLTYQTSPDVLNPRDYPVSHNHLRSYLKNQNTFHTKYQLPIVSTIAKKVVLRKHFTPEERKRSSTIKSSRLNPKCVRYVIKDCGDYLGDLFVIPTLISRTHGQAWRDKVPPNSFGAIIIATEGISDGKSKKPYNDTFPVDFDLSQMLGLDDNIDFPEEETLQTVDQLSQAFSTMSEINTIPGIQAGKETVKNILVNWLVNY